MPTRTPLLERMDQALKLRGRSAYWLQQRLQEKEVTGSSSGSVSRYMRGEITPPLEFLKATAQALSVFEPWLISGYGDPEKQFGSESDPEVHTLRAFADAAGGIARYWEEEDRSIDGRLADRCWWYGELRDSTRVMVRELFDEVSTYVHQHRSCVVPWDEMQTATGADLEIAREIGSLLNMPVQLLGLGNPSSSATFTRDQADQYVRALCSAVWCLLPPTHSLADEERIEEEKRRILHRKSIERHRQRARDKRARKSDRKQRSADAAQP